MPNDTLSAKIKADASDYISTLELASDRTDALGNQASQASERVERLGDKSTTTATSVGALGATISTTSAATSTLALATSASLVPALGALLATAVPLTATLGGLATAAGGVATGFGAVIGTGIFAYSENLKEQNKERLSQLQEKRDKLKTVREETGELTDAQQEQLDKLNEQIEATKETTSVTGALSDELTPAKEQFRESALVLGKEFIPLIRDAIDALPAFIRKIEDAIGDLTPFAEALRDAGQAAFDTVPKIVEQMMDMGRDALPAVRDLGGYLADNMVPFMEGLEETTSDVVDIMPDFTGSFADLLPKLNDVGIAVLETVLPALNDLIGGFSDLLGRAQEFAGRDDVQSFLSDASDAADIASDAFGTLVEKVGSFASTVAESDAFEQLKSTVESDLEATGKAITQISNGKIDNALGTLVTRFGNRVGEITDFLGGSDGKIAGAIQDTATFLSADGAQKLTRGADKAFGAISSAAISVRDAIFGPGGESGIFAVFIDSLGETLASVDYGDAFTGLTDAAEAAQEGAETTLVGESGEGGLTSVVSDAVADAQSWLTSEGTSEMQAAATELADATLSGVASIKTILIGPDGGSGVLSAMVDQATTWLTDSAPTLLGEAMTAVGAAIRGALIDAVVNPLKGEDSAFWSGLIDASDWLATNAPELFVAVGDAIVNAIIESFQGLVQGLVGSDDGEIMTALRDVVGEFSIPNDVNLGSIGTAIVDAIVSSIGGISDDITEGITAGLGGVAEGLSQVWNNTIGGTNILPPFEIDGIPRTPFNGIDFGGVEVPSLDTGGLIEQSGLANVHAGERVIPEAQVSDRGPVSTGPQTEIVIEELHASGRREGQQAAKGLKQAIRHEGVGR
jgi:hypothetical protein